MARAIWSGFISFGLVSVPVGIYSAEQGSGLSFRMLDRRNNARVRYERVNDETGKDVPWEEIVKGYEYAKGNYVLLSNDDFKKAAPEATQTIDIENFVALAEIEYRYFDKPYYLTPDDKGKGYVLLRDTLAASGKAGIAKVVIRSRQHLAALIADGDALVLNLLRFQQELRSTDEFQFPTGKPQDYRITKKEQAMAKELLDSMSAEWKPKTYRDEYRASLLAYIEKKAKSGKTAAEPEAKSVEPKPTNVIDFSERLRQSIARSKGRPAHKKSTRRRKSTARKQSSRGRSRSA